MHQPRFFQMPSIETAARAVQRCSSQGTGSETAWRTSCRNQFTAPLSLLKRYLNRSDTTTQLVTTGM
ncbi:hypothetical protein SPF06_13705 [Sinomonas sp. JGH33]|uniref:Uncharacterized protein n=1 Tax=Sinomonas terricola TaxID=3110330 RepID=A0ABU5T814_9MICC|nr:hypothetical protein [Sinomonas sp. JGH33]MEA5455785.1 hypothetical protein [Sinomonas sp. JGH33]